MNPVVAWFATVVLLTLVALALMVMTLIAKARALHRARRARQAPPVVPPAPARSVAYVIHQHAAVSVVETDSHPEAHHEATYTVVCRCRHEAMATPAMASARDAVLNAQIIAALLSAPIRYRTGLVAEDPPGLDPAGQRAAARDLAHLMHAEHVAEQLAKSGHVTQA